MLAGHDGTIRYATPSARDFLGPQCVAGARLAGLTGPDLGPAVSRVMDFPATGTQSEPAIWQLPDERGQVREVEVHIRDLRGEPALGGMVLTMRDVTVQRQHEEELHRRAFRDPLTGLANRALFEEAGERIIARTGSRGGLVGVALCDLDGFKKVNDTHGHPAGDELLTAVGSRLRHAVRSSDVVARFGGDEFAVLLDDLPSREMAGELASRIVDAIGAPFSLQAGTVEVGISVGIAISDGKDPGLASLVERADLALYAAKGAGKRTWREHSPGLPGIGRSLAAALDGVSGQAFPPLPSITAGTRKRENGGSRNFRIRQTWTGRARPTGPSRSK